MRTAHLTGVFASSQVSSTEHVLGDNAVIHSAAVTHLLINDIHSHLHQIRGDSACIGGKTMLKTDVDIRALAE